MHKHQPSTIDQVIRIALVAALVYWSSMLVLLLFGVLAWGFILAVALYPIYTSLRKRFGMHPFLASLVVTLLSLLVVVGSLMLMSNNMYDTVSQLTTKL